MQKDMFNLNSYYYDLIEDPSNLGDLRDDLSIGDFFYIENKRYEIVEVKAADQMWLIEKEHHEIFD